jgi:CRP-like cAMP-binding protein
VCSGRKFSDNQAVTDPDAAAAPRSETTAPPPEAPLSIDQTVELLARVNLFAALPPVYLRRIAGIGSIEVQERGSRIFEEGAPGDKVYIILEGAARISRQVPGMGEETLAILKAGDYFGEMALIDDFPRSADAIAHERSRLFVITKDHLADLLFVDRDLAYDLLWSFVRTLAGRLRETNDKMTFLAVSSKF